MSFRICRSAKLALAVPFLLLGCAESPPADSGSSSAPGTQTNPGDVTLPAPTAIAAPDASSESPAAPESVAAVAGSDQVPFRPAAADGTEATGTLMLGDTAPPVQIAEWAMGSPVKAFSNEKVYVVEFWATWCGPCRTSMPHMSTLQEEYGEKVQFIGVTDEDMETVKEFMEQPGSASQKWSDIIKYAIALDDKGKTSDAYMRASGQNGIPTAFIVGRSGRVEWIGHPMGMDDPLKQIVDGTWDVDSARAKFIASAKEEEDMMKALPALQQAMQSSAFADAVKILNDLLVKHPESERLQMILLQVLLQSGLNDELNKHAAVVIQKSNDKPEQLNQIAWMMATISDDPASANLDHAMKAITRAAELTNNTDSSILDTLARVHYSKGNLEEAISWQKKAVALAPEDPNLVNTLQEYESEAKAATSPEPPADEKPTTPEEAKTDAPAEPATDAPTEEPKL